ncbi:6462_t:CDS:10, partial [Acaulospora colombiana]
MTPKQRDIFEQIKDLIETRSDEVFHFPTEYPARDREFIKNLAKELSIRCSEERDGNGEKHISVQYESEDKSDDEIFETREKLFEKYKDAEVVEELDTSEERERINFFDWKKKYYMEKMEINYDDSEQMDKLVLSYLEGLQWVLHYYYNGVASWGWFYPYHYSPKISDLQNLERFEIKYEYGRPFKPFEQLMGVLPEGSKKFIPLAYQDLMTDPSSPIIDFYPSDFDLDMNGKKQSWEAVETYNLPTVDGMKFVKGLCDGVLLGAKAMAGFPSLETIPHTASLERHGVHVFNSESKNETMVITLTNKFEGMKTEDIAKAMIGSRIFVSWPFLQEAIVQSVSDAHSKYESFVHPLTLSRDTIRINHKPEELEYWRKKADRLEQGYNKRYGTITGSVEVIAHVLMLKGLKRMNTGASVKEYANPGEEVDYAIQTTVESVECEDPRYEEKPAIPISEEFPYGTQYDEPDFGKKVAREFSERVKYFPSYVVAKKLGMSGLTLSKLTASLHVIYGPTDQRVNLGLNLKFEAKKQKVLGYTRKTKEGWEYSEKAMQILSLYKQKFPEFIQGLENKHKEEIYSAEDFFPEEEAVTKINAIKEWLKTVTIRDLENVSLESEQLDKESIAKIENYADKFTKNQTLKKLVVKKIPRHSFEAKENQLRPIIYFLLRCCLSPNMHLHGYKVKLSNWEIGLFLFKILEMFQSPPEFLFLFMCAKISSNITSQLFKHRCSSFRGMTVPGSALLNLTRKQSVDQRRHGSRQGTDNHFGKSRISQGSMQNGYHNGHQSFNNYHFRGSGSRGGGNVYSGQNYGTNGSQHSKQVANFGRPRNNNGVSVSPGVNGYHIPTISTSRSPQVHGNNKFVNQYQIYSNNNSYRNGFNGNSSRGGNGFIPRGNRGGHFSNVSNGTADYFNCWGVTIIDSLDTLVIMDLKEEYQEAREFVRNNLDFKMKQGCGSRYASVFETTIRYLGLLAAYDLTKDELYLNKSILLGDLLLPAFDTPTGIPTGQIDIVEKKGVMGQETSLAAIGTLQLEFRRLSELTGDPIYLEKTQKVLDIIQSKKTTLPGLYPVFINPDRGHFINDWISWGAYGDSFYEQYVMVRGTTSQYIDMWKLAVQSTMENLIVSVQEFPELKYLAQWRNNMPLFRMEHLEWGWKIFRQVVKHCKTPSGFSGLKSVMQGKGNGGRRHSDTGLCKTNRSVDGKNKNSENNWDD